MIAVIQRVLQAAVYIDGQCHSQIGQGLLVLLGVGHNDDPSDADWLSRKIVHMRIFSDNEGKMNRSLMDIGGDMLVVSQFTLHASTKKGNRPSFAEAAPPQLAIPLYEAFVNHCSQLTGKTIRTGVFAADMKVSLVNDGPVTIVIDSKNRH